MTSYTQIKARIAKLEKEAQHILRKEAVKAIDTIKQMMDKYQLTLSDLSEAIGGELDGKRGKRRGRPSAKAAGTAAKKTTRRKPAAKYMNSKTGETWSGMGRPPAWIKDAVAKGKQDKFLITAAPETSSEKPSEAAAPAKKARGKAGKNASTTRSTGKSKGRKTVQAADSAAKAPAAKAPATKRAPKRASKNAGSSASTAPMVKSETAATAAVE